MRALSLFAVCVVAKVIILADRAVPLSPWTPVAYLWQDALLALLVGAFDLAARRRPWIGWLAYALVTAYVALNVPLTRLLSSPLTWQMSRAARGALADSIRHHLTPVNLACLGAVLLVAGALPFAFRRVPLRTKCAATVAALLCVALGPFATARVETVGLHRNALVALVHSALRHPPRDATPVRAELAHFDTAAGDDLSALHGAAAGRNVVMIHLESTGARYLKPYGAAEDPMPNLTKLAGQALLFENAYAVYPESIKGLLALLCSRAPAFDARPEVCAQIAPPSLAHELKGAGWRTALFHSGRFMYLGMNAVVQQRGYDTLEDAGAISGQFNSSFGVDEPATVRRMLAWIDSRPRGQRFLLNYLPIAGHHPYEVPADGPFPDADELNRHRNALHFGDAALGEFLRGLRERGLETNTLFVIFGDHGEAFGQHPGNYGHTLFLYEENVRVPLLVVAPGLLHSQRRVGRVASLVDVAPTVLDLLGLAAPPSWEGTSLLAGSVRPALFFTDYSLGLVGLRDGGWKFIHELESDRVKLFDLRTDPDERRDLSAQFPERAAAYRSHARHWLARQHQFVAQAR